MSEPTLRTNVVASALAGLTSMYAKQPNVRKILTALMANRQELENVLFDVYTQRRLRTATLYTLPTTNSVLDAIGALIGQPRDTMSDTAYQQILLLAALVRRSTGILPDWSSFAALILQTSGGPAEYLQGSAAFDFGVFDMTVMPPIEAAATLGRAVPNGLRAAFVYSTWSHTLNFTWGSVYSGGAGSAHGFGSVYEPSVGDKLVAAQPMPYQVTGSADFVPTAIEGCVLWLRADLNVIVTSGTVSLWPDQSENGNDVSQSSVPLQPVYDPIGGPNGLPCIRSTGTQYMRNGTAPLPAPQRNWTAFVVLQSTDNTVTGIPYLNGNSWGVQNTAGTRELLVAGNTDELDSTWSTSTWELWTIQDDGTHQSMRVDGTPVTIAPNTSTFNSIVSTVDVFSFNGTRIFKGGIAEIITYDRFLPLSEVKRIETYVRLRMGI